MKHKKKYTKYTAFTGLLTSLALCTFLATACQKQTAQTINPDAASTSQGDFSQEGISPGDGSPEGVSPEDGFQGDTGTNDEIEIIVTTAPATIPPLEPDGQVLPELLITVPEVVPMPEFLRVGDQHPSVAALQERLMDLGFMDFDEPTDYYGTMTERAVKIFQRQNKLAQDGIVGGSTYQAIMSPDAKHYAAQNGDAGDDITRIQERLYELGYLASESMLTGNFGDSTEAAVTKLQEVNGLEQDGKVGQKTLNLLYSDEIKANFIALGEKSEVVEAAQRRLKLLGYLMTDPDGAYGPETVEAVKQFQARNDQVVDGFLGPGTRVALNSDEARPMGLRLGDEGSTVTKIQDILSKYGYLHSGNVTGYYGEITEQAVKLFQTQNGLSSDGTVGALTLAKMSSDNIARAPRQSTSSGGSGNGGSGTNSGRGSSGGSSSGGSSSSGSGGSGSSGGGSGGGTVKMSGGVSSLISVASSKLGAPYVWGAKGPNSFDCSGFVYWCLNQVGVNQSYLTSAGWRNAGRYTRINNFSDIQAGDIVVVRGHVGIATGNGMVIDASSSNGRVIHHSLSSWWANNFICAWRIFG